MVQKFYAIKDKGAVKKGTIISTLFAVIVAGGSYFLGGFGRIFATPDQVAQNGTDYIVPTIIETMPDILIGIVIVLVLSASMSTLSSLVLTSSSTLTIDLIKPFTKKMTDKKQVITMRIFIAVFLLISVGIAIFTITNPKTIISTLMSISWGALAGAFLAPFLYGLFSKKITKAAVWTSFILGVGLVVAHMIYFTLLGNTWTLFGINMASAINCGAIVMLLSLIVVPLVSLFTPKMNRKKVDEAFACYEANQQD